MTPLQEMSAILPVALTHAHSVRYLAKGAKKEELVKDLADYIKNEAISINSTLTQEDIQHVLRILFKDL